MRWTSCECTHALICIRVNMVSGNAGDLIESCNALTTAPQMYASVQSAEFALTSALMPRLVSTNASPVVYEGEDSAKQVATVDVKSPADASDIARPVRASPIPGPP